MKRQPMTALVHDAHDVEKDHDNDELQLRGYRKQGRSRCGFRQGQDCDNDGEYADAKGQGMK